MFRFLPRDEGFFDFFERAASNLHEAALLLDKFMTDYDDLEDRAKQIHNREHTGDVFTREAIEKLHRTFMTPFDRGDIHRLVSRMDDVLDLMDAAARKLVLYRVDKPTDDAKNLAKVLIEQTRTLKNLMPMLRTLKEPQTILNLCLELHTHESEADRIFEHGLARLFQHTQNPIEVIKWKDIYADLETATDRCEDVANVIEGIILQNS